MKFIILAEETVVYQVEIEADSVAEVQKAIDLGEVAFDSSDIIDGDDFRVIEILVDD
jgi:hypothetical protein